MSDIITPIIRNSPEFNLDQSMMTGAEQVAQAYIRRLLTLPDVSDSAGKDFVTQHQLAHGLLDELTRDYTGIVSIVGARVSIGSNETAPIIPTFNNLVQPYSADDIQPIWREGIHVLGEIWRRGISGIEEFDAGVRRVTDVLLDPGNPKFIGQDTPLDYALSLLSIEMHVNEGITPDTYAELNDKPRSQSFKLGVRAAIIATAYHYLRSHSNKE